MLNMISPIFKTQKKWGRDLFGVMWQISALHYIATIIQFKCRESLDLCMHNYDFLWSLYYLECFPNIIHDHLEYFEMKRCYVSEKHYCDTANLDML